MSFEDVAEPKIIIRVPGVEDFDGMVSLLRRAGAVGVQEYRTFVVRGPVSATQVAALLQLMRFTEHTRDPDPIEVLVEPSPDGSDESLIDNDEWWAENNGQRDG